jgi:hypothetical protein
MTIVVGQSDNSFFEMAHFSVESYGNTSVNTAVTGFLGTAAGFDITHHYYHDLELNRINEGIQADTNSFRMVFDGWFPGLPDYTAFVNLDLDNIGTWMWRGSGPGTEIGPFRFQNLSYKGHGPDGQNITIVKKWGQTTGVEILDSIFDANFAAWTPGRVLGLTVNMCSQDWDIKNNKFIDISHTLQSNGFEPGQCATRAVDDILFEDNEVVFTEPSYNPAQMFKIIGFGTASPSYVEDVTVRNNTISSTGPSMHCVKYESGYAGASRAGTITFTGNTCDGNASTAMIYIDDFGTNLHDTWVIKDNSLTGLTQRNIRVDYVPANWNNTNVNNNCYDSDGGFSWNLGPETDFAGWQENSSGDAMSVSVDSCPVPDADGDGIPDDGDGSGDPTDNPCPAGVTEGCDDNCRFRANADQSDANADGLGDVCQCADMNGNGLVDGADLTLYRRYFGGLSSPFSTDRCGVSPAPDGGTCDGADLTVITRFFGGLSPGITNTCSAYAGP